MKKLIEENKIIINTGGKIGISDIVEHEIDTGNNTPIAQKPYKVDSEKREIMKKEIKKLREMGWIRKAHGPWASPVVMVKKKDGEIRFCVDYRKINAITTTDAHPLPRIEELLEQFSESKWFSSIDLASGYHQIKMKESDIEKTAFTCCFGLYEYVVMPFGLKNAPPTFQRMMNELFMDYLYDWMVVYIDDILIYSKTFEEHMEHLKIVFDILRKANLMMKLKKCKFLEQNIEFLGHIVGKDGIKVDPAKIEKVKDLKIPTTVREVRSILGLCSYYRKFVKDFSKIAKPLNELLKKNKDNKEKNPKIEWNEERQEAFEILKQKLIEAPILQSPNFNKEFILITDASGIGLGAVLSQLNNEGKEVVIAYASRTLNETEKRYSNSDRECLAIVWAIRYWHKYLIRAKFRIITDHAALKTLQTAKVPIGRRGKWMMELQQYDYKIEHKSGKENKNADALSRLL